MKEKEKIKKSKIYQEKYLEILEKIDRADEKLQIILAQKLDVKIFSFSMKYAPIDRTDRKYVGKFWKRQYLKNIYAILNITKGIVADGESFFIRLLGGI